MKKQRTTKLWNKLRAHTKNQMADVQGIKED